MDHVRRSRIPCHQNHTPTHKPLLLLVITQLVVTASFPIDADELPSLVSTVIRGSTAYEAPELFSIYSGHVGKPITSDSARAIAVALADRYVNDGYSRPRVRVDDRMVGAGVLVLDVAETRIATVEISGDPGPYGERLEALGRELDGNEPLKTSDLQATVRRMRALSGLNLTASTSSVADPVGSYRLNIDTDYRPASGAVRMTNRGTDEIGPQFVLGQITANGLLAGRADVGLTFGSATDFDEYHGTGLTSRIVVTDRDLALSASGFRSRSNPHEEPLDRNDRYFRDRLTFVASRPLATDGSVQTVLSAGFRAEDLEIHRERIALRDERLRLIELGARWTGRLRPSSQFAAGVEFVHGFNGLGSGLSASDLVADSRVPDFSLLVLDFVRVAELGGPLSWRLNSLVQWSGESLPYSERFKIGGDRIGRGFEVAEIAGDRGVGAKVELLRRLGAIPDTVGGVSVYGFYDLAAAWKNDEPGRESAATTGLGLLLSGTKINGRLEVAKPLTHPDIEGRSDPRLFLELTVAW